MKNEIFATSDLSTIAAIAASGIDYLRVEMDEAGRRVIFVFAETPQLKKLLESFWSGKLKLPALALLNTLKNLKTQIHNT